MTNAESILISSSLRFTELATYSNLMASRAYHDVTSAIEALCVALTRAEASGIPRPRMRDLIKEARDVHAMSPFVRRLQMWPRGYRGDFETAEYLLTQKNRAEAGTLGYLIEQYCLESNIAQQHRNKLQRQASEIRRSVLCSPNGCAPTILVLATSSSYDLRCIMDSIALQDFRVVLNDTDPDAIEFSLKELAPIRDRLVAVQGHAIRCARQIRERGPYDLVVAGGLFDYLNDNWAKTLISLIVNEWLAPGGKFFFTNISAGNPRRRLWMGCVADWELIERTEQDLVHLVSSAASKETRVQVTQDATSLALLVDVDLAPN